MHESLGIDHLYAIRIIDEVHGKGGKVQAARLHAHALPFFTRLTMQTAD